MNNISLICDFFFVFFNLSCLTQQFQKKASLFYILLLKISMLRFKPYCWYLYLLIFRVKQTLQNTISLIDFNG